jgi:hypothetical protein
LGAQGPGVGQAGAHFLLWGENRNAGRKSHVSSIY